MCHFITAAIKTSSAIDNLNDIAKDYNLKFDPIHNSFVEGQIPEGLLYLSKYTWHCDCGTVLGCQYHSSKNEYSVNPKDIQKLKNKGWSQSKIKRWLDEKEKYKKKLKRDAVTNKQNRAPEATEWFEFIKTAVNNQRIGKLCLLLHMYRGGVETEKVKIKKIVKVSISNITSDYLMKIREDVFYQFTK